MSAIETPKMRQHGPGSAEFVAELLTIHGERCSHNPKLRSSTQSIVPSCLGFCFADRMVILLLKISSLCQACYAAAVPNGYFVHFSSDHETVNGDPEPREDGVQWWRFRPVGFDSRVSLSTAGLPLQIASKEHQALTLLLEQGQPFYLPLFHTVVKSTLRSLPDTDKNIASVHGVSVVGYEGNIASRRTPSETNEAIAFNQRGQIRAERDHLHLNAASQNRIDVQGADIQA